MALTALQAATAVLRRVRDVGGSAHSDVIYDVLSDAQRVINAAYGAVTTDSTLTLTPGQTFYDYPAGVVRPIQVSFNGAILDRTDWRTFKRHNPIWVHKKGIPKVWDTVGHGVLFVYPSPHDHVTSPTATVRYITETADVTSASNFEVPAPYITLLMDLAVEVLLIRQRLFTSLEESASAFNRHLRPRAV